MNAQYIRDNIIIEERRNEKEQCQLLAQIIITFSHTIENWISPPEVLKLKAKADLKDKIVEFFFKEIHDDLQQLRVQVMEVDKLLNTVDYVEMNKLMVMFDQLIKKIK
jgi:hypothetical protein